MAQAYYVVFFHILELLHPYETPEFVGVEGVLRDVRVPPQFRALRSCSA